MLRSGRWAQVILVFATAVVCTGQIVEPTALPRFEVVSVKPNTSDAPASSRFPLGPGDAYVPGTVFAATNTPLLTYIRFAFGRSQGESLRVPSWVNDERFDIQGRASGEPKKDDMRLMVRALLFDRFKLAWHVEPREESVFELVLAAPGKMGPQLAAHRQDQSCEAGAPRDPTFDAIPCGSAGLVSGNRPGRGSIAGRAEPIARLAAVLSNNGFAGVDRTVLDRTGLVGNFDFGVEWAMPLPPADSSSRPQTDDTGPSLGTALREQLGLTLRPARAPVDGLVIDRVERPEPD
jgi:uncharacterized protein (TIGR03435 family)